MDTSELARIVTAERLDTPVVYGVGRLHNDAVVLERSDDGWKVYLVDERDQPIETTLRTFDDESDALEYVLLKLRQVEKARRAMDEMRARRAADRGASGGV